MARKKDKRPLTDAEIKAWLIARTEITLNHVMTHVYKYDEGTVTKEEMRAMIKLEIGHHTEHIYDTGFADGVHGSVDADDEDNPVSFEIEEEDEDGETKPR